VILPDWRIRHIGPEVIDPYAPEQVQPASYDVCLGNDFKVFQRDVETTIDMATPVDITRHVHVPDGSYLTLHPGEFALGVTNEHFRIPDDLVARIEGKSSIGRLGLMIHVTAGYIDPGFDGPITLEMFGVHPLALLLRPGMLIAHVSFHQMSGAAAEPYRGRYQGARSVEASKL
jgi:dCTP deaminase